MGRGVITRSGNPLRVSDMQKVAAGYAGTVVVLSPDVEQVQRLCENVWERSKCGHVWGMVRGLTGQRVMR